MILGLDSRELTRIHPGIMYAYVSIVSTYVPIHEYAWKVNRYQADSYRLCRSNNITNDTSVYTRFQRLLERRAREANLTDPYKMKVINIWMIRKTLIIRAVKTYRVHRIKYARLKTAI